MSNSGYNPYQEESAPRTSSPYPQQANSPYGGTPYPTSIPSFPHKRSANIPMLQPMPVPMPMSMPMPVPMPMPRLPYARAYPPGPGGLPYPVPSSTGGYPPSEEAYPPSDGGHPASGEGHPASDEKYPESGGSGYPPSSYGRNPSAPSLDEDDPSRHSEQGSGLFSYAQSASLHLSQRHAAPYVKKTPTVVPANVFNPRANALAPRKAIRGVGAVEKAIISVLTKRTNAQRLQIAVEYKTLYGKDLIYDLINELEGSFEDLVAAMMTLLAEFYAKELYNAINELGTDLNVLIEVLCTMSNDEITAIKQAYLSMYHKSLEDGIKGSDTSGTIQRLMVSLCNPCRDESGKINPQAAHEDAQALLRAGELRFGTDEFTVNMVLCQRNYAQLQLVFQEYAEITGHDIEKAIKNDFPVDAKDGFVAVIKSLRNQVTFFAKQLKKSMRGLESNDRQLIRLVVTRCEIDMVEIKKEYQAKYGESLADAITRNTSGYYKKCLLALIGEAAS